MAVAKNKSIDDKSFAIAIIPNATVTKWAYDNIDGIDKGGIRDKESDW